MRKNLDLVNDRNTDCNGWLDYVIHFFAFLSLLLISADTLGFSLFNVNIRYCQIVLVIFTVLLLVKIKFNLSCALKNKHKDIKFWLLVLFVVYGLISTLISAYTSRAILFWFYIVYNVVFILFTMILYITIYHDLAFRLFRISCFAVFGLLICQMLLWYIFHTEVPYFCNKQYHKGIYRFSLWAYEPSYFATFLVLWLGYASVKFFCSGEKKYLFDIACAVIAILITTSTSGIIGIALIFCIVFGLWLCKDFKWKKLILLLVPVIFGLLMRFIVPNVWETFVMRLFNQSLDQASGGRISGWKTAFIVFIKNFFFGVGPGCFGLYNGNIELVPTNITLELLATLGIFATIAYIVYHIVLITQGIIIYINNQTDKDAITILALSIALICFVIVLQINQGYLRLYHWLFLGFLSAKINNYKPKDIAKPITK